MSKNTTPRLIVLVGLPGSGKSTWRENFLNKVDDPNDWVVISADDIIEEKGAQEGLSYREGFERYATFANKEAQRQAHEAVRQGKNIIWDQTNMSPKIRKGRLRVAPRYKHEAVVFSIPDDELKRRLASRPDKQIPDYVINSMANRYVAPTKAEGFESIKYVRT